MSEKPRISDDELYHLLRADNIKAFNEARTAGKGCELCGTDLRSMDLRGMDARGLDMSNCYLRQADLRGLDLSQTNLEGASINNAKISGTLFPRELSAEGITLSLTHGTRMRYR